MRIRPELHTEPLTSRLKSWIIRKIQPNRDYVIRVSGMMKVKRVCPSCAEFGHSGLATLNPKECSECRGLFLVSSPAPPYPAGDRHGDDAPRFPAKLHAFGDDLPD
jgi:hypothetical protein